jgi:alpha-galactosidase
MSNMQEKIVLIGAGSAMFTKGLVADIIRRGEPAELALVDIDPEALRVAEQLARKMVAAGRTDIRISAATDRRVVLRGATAVICTIGVGGRRAWEQDVFIPRRYGIYQPVGDTVMPGGTSRALRMIPAMVAIARDVLDLAPQALFFNYGNPMAPVCRAVRKATGAPVVGLCHGVFHVAKYLAGVLGVPPAALKYAAVGINHMTWFVEVRANGQDAMPALHAAAQQRLAHARAAAAQPGAPMDELSPFSWSLFELFGAFPAVLDRHVSEFYPHLFATAGNYYGKTLGVDAHSFENTIAYGDQTYAAMCEEALSPRPLTAEALAAISGEHEQVLDIIHSIRCDEGVVYSANLPNQGQAPNLPLNAIVESPAIADGAGVRAVMQPPLPVGLVGTLATRFAWAETVVEAALEGSRDKFIQALLLDGAVNSLDTAAALADDLLAAHAQYLPQFQQPHKERA